MANCPIAAMVQVNPSLVKSQYFNGRAHFPSIERHAPSTISKLSRGKWLVSHRHHSTGTPQTQVPAAICEKLPRTLARRATRTTTSVVRCHNPNVWSNSSSRIGSASTPALCNNRSCPASALRFAVWSNSSSRTNLRLVVSCIRQLCRHQPYEGDINHQLRTQVAVANRPAGQPTPLH